MNRVAEREVGRFHAHTVVQDRCHASAVERSEHRRNRRQPRQRRVGDDERRAHAEIDEVHSNLARDARAEADARRRHFERDFVIHL